MHKTEKNNERCDNNTALTSMSEAAYVLNGN